MVAPRAGAWIETENVPIESIPGQVAPRAGAWIETTVYGGESPQILSRPVRARGLKRARMT